MYFSMSSPKNTIKTNKNIEMKNNSNNFFTCKYCGKIFKENLCLRHYKKQFETSA